MRTFIVWVKVPGSGVGGQGLCQWSGCKSAFLYIEALGFLSAVEATGS